MNTRTVEIFDHLASLGDPTRTRTLLLLDGHELTVSELCSIMQLPQSTVSRHLKALADGGWVTARSEGPSRLYTMPRASIGSGRPERAEGGDELDATAAAFTCRRSRRSPTRTGWSAISGAGPDR